MTSSQSQWLDVAKTTTAFGLLLCLCAASFAILFQQSTIINTTGANTARLRQELLDERDRADAFQLAAELSTSARVVLDQDGSVIIWSPGAFLLTGWTREEMLGQLIDRIIPEEMRAMHHKGFDAVASSIDTKIVTQINCPVLHKDGHRIPCRLMVRTFNSKGKQFYPTIIDRREDVKVIDAP